MRRAAAFVVILSALSALGGLLWRQRPAPAEPPERPIATGQSAAASEPAPARTKRLGGLDVTFIAAADTHIGFRGTETDVAGKLRDPIREPLGSEKINATAIRAMNTMPGRALPGPLGGVVGKPRGVLIAGDLTEDGKPWQWHNFVLYYGLRGGDGLVDYPVYEAHGNHDKHHSWYVLDRVRERHGGMRYAFDWDDLHLVSLGEAPDQRDLEWLTRDLSAIGRERPVILYFHFPLRGPWSDTWFTRRGHREQLARTIAGYNVIAIIHGHYHASGRYRWNGIDVYNMGASKHRRHSFGVFRVTDDRLQVASYQYILERWEWWHQKPINGSSVAEVDGGGIYLEDE